VFCILTKATILAFSYALMAHRDIVWWYKISIVGRHNITFEILAE